MVCLEGSNGKAGGTACNLIIIKVRLVGGFSTDILPLKFDIIYWLGSPTSLMRATDTASTTY